MSSNSNVTRSSLKNNVRVKTIALPVEHGGWGILFEPLVLGLAVAPSAVGFFLAIATIGAFLARHPLKLVITDWRQSRTYPRTLVAQRFTLIYGTIALLGLAAVFATAKSYEFLLPLLAAAPLGVVQLIYDAKGKSRELLPELASSCAMAAMVASITLAGGCSRGVALGFWIVLIARVVPTILYVRARLSLLYGEAAPMTLVLVLHTVALGVVTTLAMDNFVPKLAILAMGILLIRALLGFFKDYKNVTAKQIGIREICFGVVTLLALVIGYHTGL